MDGKSSLSFICSLKAEYLIREEDAETSAPMCPFIAIKGIAIIQRICELCDLYFPDVLLKSSGVGWKDKITISECIQMTVETQAQNSSEGQMMDLRWLNRRVSGIIEAQTQISTEGQSMDLCWLKSLLREIQKEQNFKELQIPKRTSFRLIHCVPLRPLDHQYSLSLFLRDVLRNWEILENYLDVCASVEHMGIRNQKSIAREFTWEIFKVTEELKQIALMISDQTLYCVDSRVLTGLELCTETVDLLRSRHLTTEEVVSCTNHSVPTNTSVS